MRRWLGSLLLTGLVAVGASCSGGSEAADDASGPEVQYGDMLEEGVSYRYAFSIHCDMEWLGELDGRTWRWADGEGPDIHSLSAPAEWGVRDHLLRGTVTLVDDDTIELSIDDEVVAVYEPTTARPPGCI